MVTADGETEVLGIAPASDVVAPHRTSERSGSGSVRWRIPATFLAARHQAIVEGGRFHWPRGDQRIDLGALERRGRRGRLWAQCASGRVMESLQRRF